MKLLGVIGDPIEHSLSPELFDYLFKALALPYRYDAYRISTEGLQGFVETSRLSGLVGFNVTIPHKETIVPFLDELAGDAQQLGAVNTVLNDGKRLIGHNTDLEGFMTPLRERELDLSGERAIVLGAGGAARAAVHGLRELNVAHITLANRTADRAHALANELDAEVRVQTCALSDSALGEALADARLLVNATSVGMRPHTEASPLSHPDGLFPDLIVYDLVYRPLQTRLLAEAASSGATTVDGLEMLIGQALGALRLWMPEAADVTASLKSDLRGYLRGKLLDEARVAD